MKPVKKMSVPPLQCLSKLAIGGTLNGTATTHPAGGNSTMPLPLFSSQSQAHNTPSVFLKHTEVSELEGEEGDEERIEFTGKCLRIGNGKYEFWDTPTSLVGRGSYGIVFRGVCLSSPKSAHQQQLVAIKRMWRVNVQSDELEAMKCVRNENLVSLLAVCDEPDDISYLVMELCDTDLDRHLRSAPGGKLAVAADMKVLVESIARGYFALFEKHIVHRDIKPQNILLLYDGDNNSNQHNGGNYRRAIRSAKITDFGVSRVLADEHMGLCNVAGTLLFMAPEVGANLVAISEYDHCADMWSVGCLLFQCLSGRTPFDESSLCRLFLYCAGGNFDAYEQPELPVDMEGNGTLGTLIHSLLQLDRAKRATPRELLEAAECSDHGTTNNNNNAQNGKEKKKAGAWR